MTSNVKRKLAMGFGLGILVVIVLLFYGDIQAVAGLLQGFQWNLIPLILSLTLSSYILRGIRFHFYLHRLGITNITLWTSIRVFVGGFSLTLTPGKFGEFIRVYWLKNITAAPAAKTAPSIIVDRIIDGLAMAILASIGALAYPQVWSVIAVILAIIIAVIIVIQIRPLALWSLNLGEKIPYISKIIHQLHTLYESAYELLRPQNFMVGLGIGLIVWTIQGVAFYLVLVGLGTPPSLQMLLMSIFTLAVGSVLGGASSLPGGLGATEASMTLILQTAVQLSQNMAAAATLVIRFFTMWFGIFLGIITVIIWYKLLFGEEGIPADVTVQPPIQIERR